MITNIWKRIITAIREEYCWFKIKVEKRKAPLTPYSKDYMRVAR